MDITKKDNHQEDISFLFDSVEVNKKGIIHIGAHKGQEVELYLNQGFNKIMLIEANPEWVDYLRRKYAGNDKIEILPYAISDRSGKLKFHIHTSQSGSTEPASILEMKEFHKIVPTLHTSKSIEVESKTLDDLFSTDYSIDDYNFINVDVQGAELQVFQGAVGVFEKIDAIISEVNLVELYEGSALEEEITSFLSEHGFEKIKCVYHELYNEKGNFRAWGECLFKRTR